MRTAGRSYNCVRGSVTNTSPSVLPGPSRQQDQAVYGHAWRGGSRHRACCSSSRAKASLSVSVRPCFAICSGGQGQPTRPVALLCVRRPPAMRVASAAVHAFNSIQTGEACRISPSGRYGSRSLSLSSLCSPLRLPPLSPRRRAVPPRPARPDGDADPCVLASRTVLCYCPIIQYGLDFPDADELLATTSNKTMSGYCHLRCGACHQGPCPPNNSTTGPV